MTFFIFRAIFGRFKCFRCSHEHSLWWNFSEGWIICSYKCQIDTNFGWYGQKTSKNGILGHFLKKLWVQFFVLHFFCNLYYKLSSMVPHLERDYLQNCFLPLNRGAKKKKMSIGRDHSHPQQLQTEVQYFIFSQKWANLKKNESWLVFVLNLSNTLGNMFSAKISEIFRMP